MAFFLNIIAHPDREYRPERIAAVAMQCTILDREAVEATVHTVERALAAGIIRIEVDMEQVKTINSWAIGLLVDANRKAAQRGSRIVLVNVSEEAKAILQILGADRVLEIQDDPPMPPSARRL